uniref:SET domain-containing protein n=1 Tax=Ciona savignyi TaxID=51511 RepID=H2YVR1_CIOSA
MDGFTDLAAGKEGAPILIEQIEAETLSKSGFKYTPVSVGRSNGPDPSLICYDGCACRIQSCVESVGSGSATACSCLSRFRVNYELSDAINSKVLVENKLTGRSTLPIFECNALCKCGDACRNREVQHGVKRQLQIFRTGSRGLGVKTLSGLHRGEFVCEYAGEVITEPEASSRAAQQKATDMNYVISVREHLGSGITATYVDPRTHGNVGRFINHSCDPNLLMLPVRVDSDIP